MRLVRSIAGPRHARIFSFPPSMSGVVAHLTDIANRRNHPHPGRSPLGALMVHNLLATIALIAGTGWLMTTDAFWGIAWPKMAHETFVSWAEFRIVLHIGAVLVTHVLIVTVLAELRIIAANLRRHHRRGRHRRGC